MCRVHLLYLWVLLLTMFCVFSCEPEKMDTVDAVLLVYIAADNDLSAEGIEKLEAMRWGWQADKKQKLLVYRDLSESLPRLLEITEDQELKVIQEFTEENSADPVVFNRVITQAQSLFPKATFNLLIFSHATGWLPHGAYANPTMHDRAAGSNGVMQKTIMKDRQETMELSDFVDAIPDHAFEYIIFETCFSAGIEVAYALKDKCRYLMASSAEIVSPGFTKLYRTDLSLLFAGRVQDFAQQAFSYYDGRSGHKRSATFSVIQTAPLDSLAAFIKEHCDFTQTVAVKQIQYFDRNSDHLFFDFGDYYAALLHDEEDIDRLKDLLAQSVVWKAATPEFLYPYQGFSIRQHSGLTTYIPQQNFEKLNEAYRQTAWWRRVRETAESFHFLVD